MGEQRFGHELAAVHGPDAVASYWRDRVRSERCEAGYAGSGEGNFYANLGAGVYVSADGGTTWTVLASAPFVGVGFYDLIVDPKTPSILYAATTNGFYKSTNSGSTWTKKRSGRCWDVSVHPNGGTVELLAAFEDGLFASSNGGNTFAAVTLPSAPSGA